MTCRGRASEIRPAPVLTRRLVRADSRRRTSTPRCRCWAACCSPPRRTADVVEVLRENDFYRPAHQLIFAAVVDLYTAASRSTRSPSRPSWPEVRLDRPGRRRALPPHPRLERPDGRQRRLLRPHRRRQVDPPPAGRGRHPHRAARLRAEGETEVSDVVDRAQAAIYDVTEAAQHRRLHAARVSCWSRRPR